MLPYQTSKATIELRELIENGVNPFDFDYDGFYHGKDKENFEKKVINHYYFSQIGQETVGRFLHMFRTKIIEIMPYYKQMYESTLLMNKEDPFESYWLEETYTSNTTDSGTSSSTVGGSSKTTATSTNNNGNTSTSKTNSSNNKNDELVHIFSDTPQGAISNLATHMSSADKNNNSYEEENETTQTITSQGNDSGSSSSEITQTNTQSNETESAGTQTHTLTRRGNIGVQSLGDEVQKLRNSFINIDMMIINELAELFLLVY